MPLLHKYLLGIGNIVNKNANCTKYGFIDTKCFSSILAKCQHPNIEAVFHANYPLSLNTIIISCINNVYTFNHMEKEETYF